MFGLSQDHSIPKSQEFDAVDENLNTLNDCRSLKRSLTEHKHLVVSEFKFHVGVMKRESKKRDKPYLWCAGHFFLQTSFYNF